MHQKSLAVDRRSMLVLEHDSRTLLCRVADRPCTEEFANETQSHHMHRISNIHLLDRRMRHVSFLSPHQRPAHKSKRIHKSKGCLIQCIHPHRRPTNAGRNTPPQLPSSSNNKQTATIQRRQMAAQLSHLRPCHLTPWPKFHLELPKTNPNRKLHHPQRSSRSTRNQPNPL